MHRALVLVSLAACSAPAAAPDAGAPDAVPVDAPPIDVTGKVFAVVGYVASPVEDATVEVRARDGDALLATARTDAEGAFAVSLSGPADAIFAVTAAGRAPTRAFPAAPLAGGEDQLLVVASADELAAWYADAGATYASGARTILAGVVDAAGDPVAGATVAVEPAAPVVYYDADAARWDPALTATTNGFALVPGAAAIVTLDVDGAGPPREIPARPDTLTIAVLTR